MVPSFNLVSIVAFAVKEIPMKRFLCHVAVWSAILFLIRRGPRGVKRTRNSNRHRAASPAGATVSSVARLRPWSTTRNRSATHAR